MTKVAIVETKPSKNNFKYFFGEHFSFDQYHLCSNSGIKKVLKRDVDIDIDADSYDWIILVGSDALKFFTAQNSVTEYSGKVVNEKFLAVINPAMLAFKPEAKPLWEESCASIIKYVAGEVDEFTIDDSIAFGIQNTEVLHKYLEDAIAHPLSYVALDSETSALYPRNGHILGFSLSYKADYGCYVSTECVDEKAEELMQELFTKKAVIFHNAKFDLAFFEYHFGFKFPVFHDTMLLHYTADENARHGLKELAIRYTKYGDYEKPMYDWIAQYRKAHGILKADFSWDMIPFEVMYTYAACDAIVTFLLFERFKKVLQNPKLAAVYNDILIPGCRFLTDIQDNGVPFDADRLLEAQVLMQRDIDAAIEKMYENPKISQFETIQGKPFNPNSVVQLRGLLFDYLSLNPTGKKTGTGANSTDVEVLTQLAEEHEVPGLIIDIRQKSKIKNTYLDKIIPQLDRDMHLRTNFNLHTTTSGRLSSSGKLNMQQLPRDNPIVKGCIKARPGHKIVAMDLTTAEVYAAAVLANDKALMDVFKQGGNFHSTVAKKVFRLPCDVSEVTTKYSKERQAAKAISFGIMYGAGAKKIASEITKSSGTFCSPSEAQGYIDDYFREFKALKNWLSLKEKEIKTKGFIYSEFGRKRRLPNVNSEDRGVSGNAIRSGLNFLVQSVASDINLLGAIDMHKFIQQTGMKTQIFALVHDSVLAEVPNSEVDLYCEKLQEFIQLDRGVCIPGAPVGCDFDVGEDYAFGKYEKYIELQEAV